jgi:hypothetical protein
VARVGEGKVIYIVLVAKPEEETTWKDLGLNGRIILTCILNKYVEQRGLDSSDSRQA